MSYLCELATLQSKAWITQGEIESLEQSEELFQGQLQIDSLQLQIIGGGDSLLYSFELTTVREEVRRDSNTPNSIVVILAHPKLCTHEEFAGRQKTPLLQ